MHALMTRPLGRTGLEVTEICAGAAQLGDMVEATGYTVPEHRAQATVEAVLAGPINFLDTAAAYGDGKSERRIGAGIRSFGGLPAGFVLATKADMDQETHDFSGAQARRSVERSLKLLGQTSLQLVYLHETEAALQTFEDLTGPGGALEALLDLQVEGVIEHLGFAGSDLALIDRYVEIGVISVVITHTQLTLLDRTAEPWIARWADDVAVVNAAPYAGGMLARGAIHGLYQYAQPTPEILRRLAEVEQTCAAFGVEVPAAALQFSLNHPAVTSTIVGMSSPTRIADTIRLASTPVPPDLWPALDGI